jgi:hypothetical protein
MAGNRLGIQGIALGTVDGIDLEYVHGEENSAGTLRSHNFVACSTLLSGEVRGGATALPKFLMERFAYRCVKLNLYINKQREWRFHRTEGTTGSILESFESPLPLETILVCAVLPASVRSDDIVLVYSGCDYLFVVRKYESESTLEKTYQFLGPGVCMYKVYEGYNWNRAGKVRYGVINPNEIVRPWENGEVLIPSLVRLQEYFPV